MGLLAEMEAMERNRIASEAMEAMVDRFARRVAQDGTAIGSACLKQMADGGGGNVSTADVEALHLWAYVFRKSPADLERVVMDRAATMVRGEE